jgi:VIT1/CCC1 family predicted Fe2+/Mn2+ transporter
MGLGGYLAARTDRDHYLSERARELREVEKTPEQEAEEVAAIFRGYGLSDEQVVPVVNALCADREKWIDFMMRYELGLEAPDPRRARQSALTIAVSYIVGGLIPLSPYILLNNSLNALSLSVAVTLVALFVFGYVKGTFTGLNPVRGGLQTLLVGGLAAGVAFAVARLIG